MTSPPSQPLAARHSTQQLPKTGATAVRINTSRDHHLKVGSPRQPGMMATGSATAVPCTNDVPMMCQ